jgi:hypothetical protein
VGFRASNMNIMGSNFASNSSYSRIITLLSGQVRREEKTHVDITTSYLSGTGYLATQRQIPFKVDFKNG